MLLSKIKVKDKKGDIFQIFFVLIILFIMGILGLLIGKMSYEFTNAYKLPISQNIFNDSVASDANQLIQSSAIPTMDFFIFLFFLGSNIGLIVAAIRVKYSPTIIFLFILLLLIEIFVASGMVNIYQGFHNEASLAPIPSMFVLTNLIFSKYMPLIFSVIGAVVLIFMYSKSGDQIVP